MSGVEDELMSSGGLPFQILVAEDEWLPGMILQDHLEEAGFEVAGPFTASSDALQWLHASTPDLALLDVHLRDGPCTEVAVELRRRGIRFVVLSGSEVVHAPEPFRAAPWIGKPSSLDDVVGAIERLGGIRSRVVRRLRSGLRRRASRVHYPRA